MKKKLIVLSIIVGLCLIWFGVYSILPYFSGDIKQNFTGDENEIFQLMDKSEYGVPKALNKTANGDYNYTMTYQYKNFPFKLLSFTLVDTFDMGSISISASENDLRKLEFYSREEYGGMEYYYYFNEKKTGALDYKQLFDRYGVKTGSECEQEIEFMVGQKRFLISFKEHVDEENRQKNYNEVTGKNMLLALMAEVAEIQRAKNTGN